MPVLSEILTLKPAGLFCIPGNFYIDPISIVDSAVITHGHADHACAPHSKVLASPETIAIMKLRFGDNSCGLWQSLECHQPIKHNQVQLKFIPAGHILGSVQLVIEASNQRVIISGDYKRAPDPTCSAFQAEHCDFFVSEATFGLPVFRHPPIEEELKKVLKALEQSSKALLIGAYTLGKSQRLIKSLRMLNYSDPIYAHGSILKMCALYQHFGVDLGELRSALLLDKHQSAGKIILCPPQELHSRWSRRFGDLTRAYASGWMQIRARAKQKLIDLPLIISDHADWFELIQTIEEIHPEETLLTHGMEEALTYYFKNKGYNIKGLDLIGQMRGGN